MNELPEGWVVKKLGDVCETTSGGTPNRKDSSLYGGHIPWVKSGELDKGIITDTEEKITDEAIKKSSAKVFPKGTLLIALYGATIGKLAFLGIAAATNQAICGIFENKSIDSKYLYQFLFFSKAGLVKQGIGGAQPNISQGILKNLDLPLPPLPIQHAIVTKIEEIFSELDHGVAQLKVARAQLKVYRQAVLKWAFEGKLTNEGVVDGELSEGWKFVKIGTVVKCIVPNRDKPKSFSGNIPWLTTPDLDEGSVSINFSGIKNGLSKEEAVEYKAKVIPLDSVVMTCVGKFGVAAVVTKEIVINQHLHAFLPSEVFLPKYIAYNIINQKTYCESKSTSTTIAYLNKENCNSIPIPLCPLPEQHQIVTEIERRLSVCDKLEETIEAGLKQAEVLRAGVLKMAFEGGLV